jgi:hypothetical protein
MSKLVEQPLWLSYVSRPEYNFAVPPTPVGNYSQKKKENSHRRNDLVCQWRANAIKDGRHRAQDTPVKGSSKLAKLILVYRIISIKETVTVRRRGNDDKMVACQGETATTTVCVTGAGGFIASWLVQRLLSSGSFVVHGAVRDPSKQDHRRPRDTAG